MLPAFAEFLRGQLRMVGLAYIGAAGVAMASLASLLFLTPVGQVVQEAIRVPLASISGLPAFVMPEVVNSPVTVPALPDAPLAPPSIASVPLFAELVEPPPSETISGTELLLALEEFLRDEPEDQADDSGVDPSAEDPEETLAEPELDLVPEAQVAEPEIPAPAVPMVPAVEPIAPSVSTSVEEPSPVVPPSPSPPIRRRPSGSEGVSGTSSTPTPEVRRALTPTTASIVQPTEVVPTPVPPNVVPVTPSVASTVEVARPGTVVTEPAGGPNRPDEAQHPDVAVPAGGPNAADGCGPETSRRPADSPACPGTTNPDRTPTAISTQRPSGRPASAVRSPTTGPVRVNSNGKVGVCHATGTPSQPFRYLEVEASAVPAHAAHGDRVGITQDACTGPSAARTPSSTSVRGQGGQSRSGR